MAKKICIYSPNKTKDAFMAMIISIFNPNKNSNTNNSDSNRYHISLVLWLYICWFNYSVRRYSVFVPRIESYWRLGHDDPWVTCGSAWYSSSWLVSGLQDSIKTPLSWKLNFFIYSNITWEYCIDQQQPVHTFYVQFWIRFPTVASFMLKKKKNSADSVKYKRYGGKLVYSLRVLSN